LGYPFGEKRCKVYDLETHEIFVSRDVAFNEEIFPSECKTKNTDNLVEHYSGISTRMVHDDFGDYNGVGNEFDGSTYLMKRGALNLGQRSIRATPTPYLTAHKGHGPKEASPVCLSKGRSLEDNRTWEVMDLPPDKKNPISYKCVYRVKYHSDSSIQRYKARLVIRGDHQIKGFDYNKTFAPMAKMTSVQCFLAVAISKGWDLDQMDVNNAFLHGDLEEEVHMRMPLGFSSCGANKVCKLQKYLYGL